MKKKRSQRKGPKCRPNGDSATKFPKGEKKLMPGNSLRPNGTVSKGFNGPYQLTKKAELRRPSYTDQTKLHRPYGTVWKTVYVGRESKDVNDLEDVKTVLGPYQVTRGYQTFGQEVI